MKGRQRIAKNRSKGAIALAHCGASTDQIAHTIVASDATVNYWISGEKKPNKNFRRGLKHQYGINPKWWDELAPPEDETWILAYKHNLAKRRNGDPLAKIRGRRVAEFVPFGEGVVVPGDKFEMTQVPEVATTAKDVRDLAGQYLDQVRMFMSEVQTDKILTMTEKARTLRECAAALDKAGRLTGASAEIPVSKILKSPAWAKLGKIIADTIASHDDAKVAASIMRKLGEALKGAE